MKKAGYLIIIFLFFSSSFFAQDKSRIKIGTPNKEELNMKYYEMDSTAEAVVLYNYANIYYTYNARTGVNLISNYHKRIKVLKKSGLDLANFTIPYFQGVSNNREIIRDLIGYTYNNENGEIITTKLTSSSIFDEQIIDERHQKKISMPNVKEGSVFEYSYTIETPFSFANGPKPFLFQGRIPYKWSELNIVIPNFFQYKIILGGYIPLLINTKESVPVNFINPVTDAMKYKFATQNIPALHNELYIPSVEDYISKIDFELSSLKLPNQPVKYFTQTWQDIDKILLESNYFGKKLEKTNLYLKDVVSELSAIKDSTAKLNASFEYISKNIKWDHNISITIYKNLKEIFVNRKGNESEINLLLVNLLRELGFDANPVVLSTRDNGKINQMVPLLDKFNYVIAQVEIGGKDILLDATEPNTFPGFLPERCLNGNGLLIKEGVFKFISLSPQEKNYKYESIKADLDSKSGNIIGKNSIVFTGYSALEIRNKINAEGNDRFKENLKNNLPDLEVDNCNIENQEKPMEKLKISYDFITENKFSNSAIVYINPFLTNKVTSNPFNEIDRIYPADLGKASDETYVILLKIPNEYIIDELPKSSIISLPDNAGKYTYSADVADNLIRISSRITINKTYFESEDYANLSELYNNIIQKQAEQIVLKRK